MRITERKLRSLIRSVIIESSYDLKLSSQLEDPDHVYSQKNRDEIKRNRAGLFDRLFSRTLTNQITTGLENLGQGIRHARVYFDDPNKKAKFDQMTNPHWKAGDVNKFGKVKSMSKEEMYYDIMSDGHGEIYFMSDNGSYEFPFFLKNSIDKVEIYAGTEESDKHKRIGKIEVDKSGGKLAKVSFFNDCLQSLEKLGHKRT